MGNVIMKKLVAALGIIAILVAAGIGSQIGRDVGKTVLSPQKLSQDEIEVKLMESFATAARQYNQRLPMMLDDNTRLDRATVGPGPRVVYHHTFPKYTSRDIDSSWLHRNLRPDVVRKVCASGDMKQSLQYGGIYVYSYSGNDGIEVASFEIDGKDCGLPRTSP